jgi:hypothetical protein
MAGPAITTRPTGVCGLLAGAGLAHMDSLALYTRRQAQHGIIAMAGSGLVFANELCYSSIASRPGHVCWRPAVRHLLDR